jgi:hypothetical protein
MQNYQPYPYQQAPQQQIVKVYKASWPSYSAVKSFQHDAQKMALQGWRVVSQSSMEKVSLGRKGITVVYVR